MHSRIPRILPKKGFGRGGYPLQIVIREYMASILHKSIRTFAA
jgi:hypothetical protein